MSSKSNDLDLCILTWVNLASNWPESLLVSIGQELVPGIISFKFDITWQPLQTPKEKVSVLLKNSSNWSFKKEFIKIELAQPRPAPKTSPKENPPGKIIPWKLFKVKRLLIKSLICRSVTSKPAFSNAAAISIWPLTPCSLITAKLGLFLKFNFLGISKWNVWFKIVLFLFK